MANALRDGLHPLPTIAAPGSAQPAYTGVLLRETAAVQSGTSLPAGASPVGVRTYHVIRCTVHWRWSAHSVCADIRALPVHA